METNPRILRGHSCLTDAAAAVAEFHTQVAQDELEIVIFFCSSKYDLNVIASEMNRLFAGVEVIGCTTAGEIGSCGYESFSLSGTSFNRASATALSCRIGDLGNFSMTRGYESTSELWAHMKEKVPEASPRNTFALLLIDGLSVREEQVVRAVQSSLGGMSLIGGSAGDDSEFSQTWVFHKGAFHTNSAVLLLVCTPLHFMAFKTQHFVCEEERLVVTEADVTKRIVKEINGLPAAKEYARVIGLDADKLDSGSFASWPVVVVIDGTDYVRSIQQANPDGTLTFFCAIDEGLVLRVARGQDLLGNLKQALDEIREELGSPQIILSCDCILRNQEITQTGIKGAVGELLNQNNAVGFSTYGEQYGGVHVNQTFTAIAIGGEDE